MTLSQPGLSSGGLRLIGYLLLLLLSTVGFGNLENTSILLPIPFFPMPVRAQWLLFVSSAGPPASSGGPSPGARG